MRVLVTPVNRPRDALVLVDGSPLNTWPIRGEVVGLQKDGLEGWYESATPRVDLSEISQQHGSYWPGLVLMNARILTIRGFHRAFRTESSTLAVARIRDQLAALVGEDLAITVEDAAGPRTVTGILTDQVATTHKNTITTLFSLIITCPDPIKYGPPVPRSASGGTVQVENLGSADTWPTIDATGTLTNLRLALAGRVVEWQGSSTGLHLDMRDGLPMTPAGVEVGALVHDDLLVVPPGTSSIEVTTVPAGRPVTVTVRSGWK
jgi:hypothetical protein